MSMTAKGKTKVGKPRCVIKFNINGRRTHNHTIVEKSKINGANVFLSMCTKGKCNAQNVIDELDKKK